MEDFLGKFTDALVDMRKQLESKGKSKWRHFLINWQFLQDISKKIADIYGKIDIEGCLGKFDQYIDRH